MKKVLKVLKWIFFIALWIISIIALLFIIPNFSRLTERFGVIDEHGNTVIDCKYLVISIPDNGKMQTDAYEVTVGDFLGRPVTSQYIDLNGIICFDESDRRVIYPDFHYNRAGAYSIEAEKEGFIDIHKKKINPFIYDEVDDYDRGYAVVYKYDETGENLLAGLVDLDENLVLDYKYEDIFVMSDEFFYVSDGDTMFLVNRNGEQVSETTENDEFIFKNMNDLSALGPITRENIHFYLDMLLVRDGEKESYFDNKGHLLHTYENEEVHGPVDENYLVVYSDEIPNGYIVDVKNGFKEVFKLDDYKIWNVIGGRIIIKDEKTQKYGMMDLSGNIIVPVEYDGLGARDDDETHVIPTKGNKKGLMNLDGVFTLDLTNKYKLLPIGDGNTYIISKREPVLFAIYGSIIGLIAVNFLFSIISFIKFIIARKKNKKK